MLLLLFVAFRYCCKHVVRVVGLLLFCFFCCYMFVVGFVVVGAGVSWLVWLLELLTWNVYDICVVVSCWLLVLLLLFLLL